MRISDWSSDVCSSDLMQDDVRVTVVATGLNRAVTRQAVPVRGEERDFGREQARRPQVQLIHNQAQGKHDGTTGMVIEAVAEPYTPGQGIASALRGRRGSGGGGREPRTPKRSEG